MIKNNPVALPRMTAAALRRARNQDFGRGGHLLYIGQNPRLDSEISRRAAARDLASRRARGPRGPLSRRRAPGTLGARPGEVTEWLKVLAC